MCVTRRLVATGGGKQVDLYCFDRPRGRGYAEGGSRKVRGRKRKMSIPGSEMCAAGCVTIQTQISVFVFMHCLPQPVAQFPVCQHW